MEYVHDEVDCEVCNNNSWTWADEDGVLRCEECHTTIVEVWGPAVREEK